MIFHNSVKNKGKEADTNPNSQLTAKRRQTHQDRYCKFSYGFKKLRSAQFENIAIQHKGKARNDRIFL